MTTTATRLNQMEIQEIAKDGGNTYYGIPAKVPSLVESLIERLKKYLQ